uniref:CSON001535 protein n=1 Tax=Culicoides sonorensis TaxID=179676 RepID=A0A336L156_CULSO
MNLPAKLIIFFWCHELSVCMDEPSRKIFNGIKASEGQFPSVVYVKTYEDILTLRHILTAGHCVVERMDNKKPILYDRIDIFAGGTDVYLFLQLQYDQKVILHENFGYYQNTKIPVNDLAIIKTEYAFSETSTVKVAQLPEHQTWMGAILTVPGFGMTENSELSQYLLYINMKIVHDEECKAAKQSNKSPDAVLCVISTDAHRRQGLCTGDSGSPMFLQGSNIIVGVHSFIISYRHVLTAAHCVVESWTPNKTVLFSRFDVFAGTVNVLNFTERRYSAKVFVHPQYKFINFALPVNDIAIIKTFEPFPESSFIKVAQLPIKKTLVGDIVTSVGWGKMENDTYTDNLLFVKMKTVNNKKCEVQKALHDDNDAIMCISGRGAIKTEGVCFGDSGGPSFRYDTNIIVGITSYVHVDKNIKCSTTQPQCVTNVLHYIEWILVTWAL